MRIDQPAPALTSSLVLKAGQRVGPYRVHTRIGSGATADVFRAEHVWLDRQAALKILPPGDAIDRFLDEARLLARLSHPGLVRIYDSDVLADGGAYLAIELLEGESLQ